jgi:hypothetical protein
MTVRFALPPVVRLPPPMRRAAHNGRVRWHRWRRMIDRLADRTLQDRHSAAADRGNTLPFRDRTERFYQFCQDCRDDTPHDGFTEIGLGWCAQIFRCCRCGRQSMRIQSWW